MELVVAYVRVADCGGDIFGRGAHPPWRDRIKIFASKEWRGLHGEADRLVVGSDVEYHAVELEDVIGPFIDIFCHCHYQYGASHGLSSHTLEPLHLGLVPRLFAQQHFHIIQGRVS